MTGAGLTPGHPTKAYSWPPPIPAGAAHHPPRHRRKAMIGKLIKAALIAAVLAARVQSLPDIKRYLELRDM